jgi:DNA-binding MarR family transcriptional regulator
MGKREIESRHPLVGLVDETIRLNSRLRSVFAAARQHSALNDSEHMVLNAVVEAARTDGRAPTVAQIGRSMGEARQLVQRAANSLRDAGLIEAVDNPDHKRAPLLLPTDAGRAAKREIDVEADAIAALTGEGLDPAEVRAATALLRAIRKQLEARLRSAR